MGPPVSTGPARDGLPLAATGLTDRPPASEKCQQEKRKTVNGEDILFAMSSLGFENYAEALKIYLTKYRDVLCPPAPSDPMPCFSSVRRCSVGTES